ncbi:MAG: hypothetical protein WBV89_05125 [Ilumatobacter sp.]
MSLQRYSGVDTWHGPRADACGIELSVVQRAVRDAADDLDIHAQRLERSADDLVTAAIRAAQEARLPPFH